jgi:uncharacterized protein (DUF305 family)
VALVLAASCAPATGQTPPAPAPAPHPHTPADTTPRPERRGYTEADVRFMQGMIAHHAQALEMTALVPSRSASGQVKLLSQRIEVSQNDEIAQMQRWLRRRGETVPGPHAHHEGGHRMPGMLTPEEMARLAAATGAEFDRLFLESMIRHHEGALVMVAELFASRGGGQDTQIYEIAAGVDSDQRIEIDRMRAMLQQMAPASGASRR